MYAGSGQPSAAGVTQGVEVQNVPGLVLKRYPGRLGTCQ